MKCNDCGALGITGTSCPDCGGENLVAEAGGNKVVSTAAMQTALPAAELPAMPGMPEAGVVTNVTGPVIGTIVLPDGRRVELREGDEFTVANTETDATVTLKADDESVSRTPVRIFAKDGKMLVTGGGSNGFSTITTVRHKPEDEIELPRGANIAVGAGKNTKLVIK